MGFGFESNYHGGCEVEVVADFHPVFTVVLARGVGLIKAVFSSVGVEETRGIAS